MRGFSVLRRYLEMKAQARHILVKTAEEAEQLKQRIAKGEAFDVLAKSTRPARRASAVVTWARCVRGRWSAPSTR